MIFVLLHSRFYLISHSFTLFVFVYLIIIILYFFCYIYKLSNYFFIFNYFFCGIKTGFIGTLGFKLLLRANDFAEVLCNGYALDLIFYFKVCELFVQINLNGLIAKIFKNLVKQSSFQSNHAFSFSTLGTFSSKFIPSNSSVQSVANSFNQSLHSIHFQFASY